MICHINELRGLAESSSEMSFIDGNLIWFKYLESHYLFLLTMLASKGDSRHPRVKSAKSGSGIDKKPFLFFPYSGYPFAFFTLPCPPIPLASLLHSPLYWLLKTVILPLHPCPTLFPTLEINQRDKTRKYSRFCPA